MKKRKLQQLVKLSYTKSALDDKKVLAVADTLDRKNLKQYLRLLKNAESKKTVVVSTPMQLSATEKKQFETLFKDKNLEFIVDPSIITGVRIRQNDVIFEDSLNQTFEQMITSIENYE